MIVLIFQRSNPTKVNGKFILSKSPVKMKMLKKKEKKQAIFRSITCHLRERGPSLITNNFATKKLIAPSAHFVVPRQDVFLYVSKLHKCLVGKKFKICTLTVSIQHQTLEKQGTCMVASLIHFSRHHFSTRLIMSLESIDTNC